jgi:hypothetical protein
LLQGFAQNLTKNYSVQLRTFLLDPELQRNMRNFFSNLQDGSSSSSASAALLEAAAERLNYSQNQTAEWKLTLQNYFQGNFR